MSDGCSEVPDLVEALSIASIERGPCDVDTVCCQKEAFCRELGDRIKVFLADQFLLFGLQVFGEEVQTCFLVNGESTIGVEQIEGVHLHRQTHVTMWGYNSRVAIKILDQSHQVCNLRG